MAYVWQLTVVHHGTETMFPQPPQSEARFAIVEAVTAAEIEEAKQSGSHLAAAFAFARAGMKNEAATELPQRRRQGPHCRACGEISQERGGAGPAGIGAGVVTVCERNETPLERAA